MKMQEGVRFFPIFWNRPEPGKRKRMFRCSAEEGNVFPGMELNFRVDFFGFGATLSSGKENGGDAMNLAELMRFGERKSGAVICLEPLHCAFVGDSPLKLAPDQFLHHGAFCRYHKTHQGLGECSRNKARSIEIARRGRAFSGCCPCGIWDLALPILWRGELTGVLYLGGFAGFASAYFYENSVANPSPVLSVLIALICALAASALGGLIYAFLTITLRANQNVTGLALTTFGMGVANFFGVFILNGSTYSAAPLANKAFAAKIPVLSGLGVLGQTVFSYGFLAYAAIVLALVLHWFFTRTRAGLNLRAVGENPATADAAGINVTKYKYLATCIGAAICGVGGLYYVLDYNQGIWATTGQIEALGWLALALVIFTTWKPLNAIWGAYLFGILYWLYQFLPSILGITMSSAMTDLVQMVPYVVTIVVLIAVSMRRKKEDQPPAQLRYAFESQKLVGELSCGALEAVGHRAPVPPPHARRAVCHDHAVAVIPEAAAQL